ncbi:Receptor-like kinase [Melia azedarach]|uniref:Receptor-like kinase n=1 Tax=Melia azedarach TaxID=155640 RepID=A0ACC1YSQ6_MELAZ|nr:Receptor-like kinase [Melia azedarach]
MAVPAVKYSLVFVVVLSVVFLNLYSNATVINQKSSAYLNTSWHNSNHSTAINHYKSTDGTIVRTILTRMGPNGYPNFGFGFLGNSTNEIFYLVTVRFLGRTSLQKHNRPPVILWFANGNSPVKENATLEFTVHGDLILRNVDEHHVWSTNTSSCNVTRMTLDGNGSFNLVDGKMKRHIWKSFDYPKHTWVPNQPLHFHRHLTSTVSASNLSTGMFLLNLSTESIHIYFNMSPAQKFQTITYGKNFPFGLVFHRYTNRMTYKTEGKSIIRLETDGRLNIYFFASGHSEIFDLSRDEHSDDNCSCPGASIGHSSHFEELKDAGNGFSSCQEMQPDNFLELENVTCFAFVPRLLNIDLERCKRECLQKCSCKAALFQYESKQKIGNCSLPTENFCLKNSTKAIVRHNSLAFIKVHNPSQKKKLSLFLVLIILPLSSFLAFIPGVCCFFLRWRKNRTARGQTRGNSKEESSVHVINILQKFSLKDLISATQEFQVRLGRGGFGSVFEGVLYNGTKVAVKRLGSEANQGKKEFLSEVQTIGSIHHFNLVKLIGYCAERSNRLLVYEFMCNGSLDKWIFQQNQARSLTWETRKKIIVQIAKGLEYLHDHCNPNIIHFDIKPQNILLDEDFNVKISDFGLARLIDHDQTHVSTMPKGTPGYMAPELIRGRNITAKIDIYSFGVVILEIICGRKNSNSWHGDYLIDTVKIKAQEDQLSDLVDEQSEDIQRNNEHAVKMIQIAILCLQKNLYRRPSASILVKVFEGLMNLEPVTDYSFLNSVHVETHQEANPGDTSILASVLSGPR